MADHSTSLPNVSVILVTFNGWHYTQRCVSHLLAEHFTPGLEIIAVDNGSTDGTPDRLRSEFPTVRVLESDTNIGFGAACNRGVQDAQGEFCVLLNNDALLGADQLTELLTCYRDRQLHGIYTARIVNEQGEEEASCFHDISADDLLLDVFLLMRTALRRHSVSLSAADDEALAIDACSGAFWLAPKRLWQDTGGFDPEFFMYYEDLDLCRRAREHGYRCFANSRIDIVHTGGGSSVDDINRQRRVDRSQRLFYRKHYGASGAFKARLHQVLRSGPRALVHALLVWSAGHRKISAMHAALTLDALRNT